MPSSFDGSRPPPRPIRIQRWSIRRIVLWTALVLLLVVIGGNARSIYYNWFGGGLATETSLHIDSLGCDEWEPLWLQAQAVPTATLVPCVRVLPAAWMVANVAVNDGRSVITVGHDRAGDAAVEVRFRFSGDCNVAGAAEGPSAQAGVRRYQSIGGSAVWYDRFAGGCVTARVHSTTDLEDGLANELLAVLGYISRQTLADALETRSDGRLHLDPDTGS